MTTSYIAHPCPGCGALAFITDDDTFVNGDRQPITNCPKCGKRLVVPPALREMREIPDEPLDDDDDLPGGLWQDLRRKTK